jgi:hypothetical protein
MTEEKAIDLLDNLIGMIADNQNSDYDTALKMGIKALKQEPRWIPVSEDAPPKGTICLWCNKQGRVFTSEITYRSECSSYVGKHGYFSNGLENHGDIVAWMPLPLPWEGE